MPTFVLKAKAELEGIIKFIIPEDHVWNLDVKQAAGDEERLGVDIDPDEEHEVPNAKNASANFLIKFPGDRTPSYCSMVKLPGVIGEISADATGFTPIAAFECRGMEPTKWNPTGYYTVEALEGTKYDEVGFRDGEDWCEFDEKSGESMMVTLEGFVHKFELHRG